MISPLAPIIDTPHSVTGVQRAFSILTGIALLVQQKERLSTTFAADWQDVLYGDTW